MNQEINCLISPLCYSLLIAITSISFLGCLRCEDKDDDWRKPRKAEFGIPPYARYLENVKICLDRGHGGQGHVLDYKRGPNGVRVAEANLRVALYLRKFLAQVGAIVIMTRKDDSFVSIPDRSNIAKQNEVVCFISPHHGAMADAGTNYTASWYHRDADD